MAHKSEVKLGMKTYEDTKSPRDRALGGGSSLELEDLTASKNFFISTSSPDCDLVGTRRIFKCE